MNQERLDGKKVLVVGLARSGVAAARFLLRRGALVTLTDVKAENELAAAVSEFQDRAALSLGGHREEDFLQADLIVLSPGVPSLLEPVRRAAQRGIPVWSEVELACRFLDGPVIGITGSNGKTTTTALVGRLFADAGLPHAVAGNIGSPLIGLADEPASDRTLIVELSSFQLENIHRFRCRAAALLNVTPDHLDRYGDFQEYAEAKRRIFLNQTEQDWAVLNADDPVASRIAGLPAQVIRFSRRPLPEGVFVQDGEIRLQLSGRTLNLMRADEIRLRGSHNLENVLAAAAIGWIWGLQPESMAATFRSFEGVEHRLEFVRALDGVHYYNDSKATNVDSAGKAIESFDEPLILILGGLDKGGDFTALRPLVSRRAKLVVVTGKASDKIAGQLAGAVPILRSADFQEAVDLAHREARPGDVVLLAPACASFDAFHNYEHRGRVFKQLVGRLAPRNEWAET